MDPAEASDDPAVRLLREVTENAPGYFFQLTFDADGHRNYRFVSSGIEALTGYGVDELVANADLIFEITDPADHARIRQAWDQGQRNNGACTFDYRIRTKRGEKRWLRSSAAPTVDRDGQTRWNGFTIDITAEKEAERRTQEAEELVLELIESLPGVVQRIEIEWGKPTRYSLVSSNVEQLFGIPREEVLAPGGADKITSLIDKVDIARITDVFRKTIETGQPMVYDYGMLSRDGQRRRVRVSSSVQTNKEGAVAFSYAEDVTEEYEVRAQLAEAKEAAETANRIKSEFLANMSHEIRTPMNAIVGLSRLGIATDDTDKLHDNLRNISRAAQALLGIINDILDFSKIEAGKLELEVTRFKLGDVLEGVTSLLSGPAAEKQLALKVNLEPGLPETLLGDPLRLHQVLLNLAGNAVKFTERGSVTVSVRRDGGSAKAPCLRFEVADTGVGMDPDQLDRLFSPFAQADSSTTRRHGGTGLGLSISRRLVDLMGGKLTAQSEPGRGSMFSFAMVFAPSDTAVTATTAAASGELKPGLKVLVVEDDELNQMVATDLLQGLDVVVTIASSGREALELVATREFDLILMDVQMPVMDGFETTAEIRALGAPHATRPIIAMTANAMADDRKRCLAAGMDDYVAKPIDHRLLKARLAHWAGRSSAWQPKPAAPLAAPVDETSAENDVFDFAAAEERLGSRALLLKLARKFVGDKAAAQRLYGALDAGRREDALTQAHTLKGTAGTLGAGALQVAAANLEQTLKGGGSYDEALRQVHLTHNQAVRELDVFLDSQ